MKRCPECWRDYYDETLLYCLDDGTQLLESSLRNSGLFHLFQLKSDPSSAVSWELTLCDDRRTAKCAVDL